MNTKTKILFSEIQIESRIEDLEFELEDLKNRRGESVIIDRMITSRKEAIKSLKKQPMFINIGGIRLDMKGLTVSYPNNSVNQMIFLTGRFATGHLFGFWSCHPCGLTTDQDKGWAVIDPTTLEMVEDCTTRSSGFWSGDFINWRKDMKSKFGKLTKFTDHGGEMIWKNNE